MGVWIFILCVQIILLMTSKATSNSTLFARRGDGVTLSCPSPTRQWFKLQNDNTNIVLNDQLQINPALPYAARLTATNDTTRNSIDIHIQSVTDIDVAVYSCTFSVNNTDWKIQFSLYVEPDSPVINNTVQGGSYIEGTEGQQLSMTCQSYNGNPPADVTWKTGTTDLAINKDTVTYQFTPSRTNHLQTYTCVSNSAALSNPLQTSVQLLLNLRPLSPVVTVSSVKEGDDIVAQCTSTGSRPAAILSWFIDHVLQSPTGQQQTTFNTATQTYNVSLEYRKASSRSDNTKNLTCRANNTVVQSSITGQQQLNVWFGPDTVTISGSSTLNENTVLSLRCNAALSSPQSTLSWYKNGSPLTVSGPVSTQNGDYGGKTTHQTHSTTVRRQDNGANVTCVATSTARSAGNSVILNVRYRPTVQIQPSNQSVIVGSTNVVFSCVVTDGNPRTASSYSWRKGGNQIGTGQTYTIQTVNRSHAGTYSCTGTNVAGRSDQATSTLVVLYPPVIASIPNQTPEEGSMVTVTCTVTSSNPAPDRIYWTRSKDSTFRHNSAVLSIPNISRTHTDNYTCHAENTMSPTSRSPVVGSHQMKIIVNVLYGPGTSVEYNHASSTISMEENNTRILPTVRCSADCNPPCQYSWSGNTVSNDATLNLGIATRNKNGTYTCRARNTINGTKRESQKGLNVLIFYRANITSLTIQGGSVHNESSDVFINCTVDSYPHSNITWSSTGTGPQSTLPANPSSSLLLRNVSCYDTANYTCRACNGYGTASVETRTLYVRCTPRLPTNEKEIVDIGLGDGENLTISSVYVAYPEPIITWNFRAKSQNTSNMISQPQVEQIGLNLFRSNFSKEVKDNEFGEYKSVANNNAGSRIAQQFFKVDANRKPSVVKNISAECLTSSTANISWTPGFDGGLSQWFNIMYRPFTTDTFTSSSNISNTEDEPKMFFIIFQLAASTRYIFKVKSSNSLGYVFSLEVDCKTDEAEEEGSSNAALVGGVAGTSAAVLLIIVVIVVVLLFRKMQSKKYEDEKELSERSLASMNEIPDGIKDNILYESAGNDFSQQRQDVYAEVVKPKKKGAALKTNDVYAEVEKPKKTNNKKKQKGYDNKVMTDVYENVSDFKGAAKHQDGKSSNQNPAERGYRNEDGLLYVDVAIKPSADGRKNVIIGEEERTDYASVDFVVPP